ncbi:MAG: NnrU family protein [Geminicoccaceae bacterium]
MTELFLAAFFLLATHVGVSSSALRATIVAKVGIAAYLIAHSVLALAAFAWLIGAYGRAPFLPLWQPNPWQAWLVTVIMPLACLLLVGGLTTANPTLVGRAFIKRGMEAPSGVLRITRHPTMGRLPSSPSCI